MRILHFSFFTPYHALVSLSYTEWWPSACNVENEILTLNLTGKKNSLLVFVTNKQMDKWLEH